MDAMAIIEILEGSAWEHQRNQKHPQLRKSLRRISSHSFEMLKQRRSLGELLQPEVDWVEPH
jgi:hypothetical protein